MSDNESAFIRVANTSEIPAGTMKMFRAIGEEILLVNTGNAYYAIANRCTHRKGDLSKGRLEGNIIKCPVHGSKFDVTTGKNVDGPTILFIKGKTGDLKSYQLKIIGNEIYVA
ncbi:MAG: Rieske 2Fe-2S domain-containing protein [Candidatus Bathyarchaeota archaeon]|nr:Rieske 2Fe-2S domain-containing protein [Candidatus Bathyarchaeota archaeon]